MNEVAPKNELESEVAQATVEVPALFDFQKTLPRLTKQINDWSGIQRQTDVNRKMRKLDVDLDSLRLSGDLKADETFIPIRVIDVNIKQGQPLFNNYLTKSRRLIVYEPLAVPRGSIDTQDLEMEFTKLNTYIGWQEPFFDWTDGSELHGWSWIEVEKDDSKTGKVNINFLGREDVIFPVDCVDKEACEIIIVQYDFTVTKVKEWISRGWFNAVEGQKIVDQYKDQASKEDETFKLYKKWCKYDGAVYVAWFNKDNTTSNWLRAPEKLSHGRKRQELVWKDVPTTLPDIETGFDVSMVMKQQVLEWVDIDETIYPIHLLRHQKTEEKPITETKGRAWLDGPKQDAQTCLWSNFVNASTRASNVYGSPEFQSSSGGRPVKLELELEPGAIYSEPLKLWSPPMPSMDLVRAAQSLDTQTQMETGRVAFAAINNQDSRKTATEVGAAEQQNQLLNSVQVTLFSIALCGVWNQVWSIQQSLALQGEIPFLTNGPKDEATGKYANNVAKLSMDYLLKPAGDIDVIERAELQMKREKLWPLITSLPTLVMNPVAIAFAKDMIEENFPEDAPEYNAILDQMIQQAQMMMAQQNMAGSLMDVIKSLQQENRAPTPEEVKQLEGAMAQTQQQQPAA